MRGALVVLALTGIVSLPAWSAGKSGRDCLWRICAEPAAPHAAHSRAHATKRGRALHRGDTTGEDGTGNLFSSLGHNNVPAFAGPGAGTAGGAGQMQAPMGTAPRAAALPPTQGLPRIPNATAGNRAPAPPQGVPQGPNGTAGNGGAGTPPPPGTMAGNIPGAMPPAQGMPPPADATGGAPPLPTLVHGVPTHIAPSSPDQPPRYARPNRD